MQKDTIVKVLQCRDTPEGTPMGLKNCFFPSGNFKNLLFIRKLISDTFTKIFFFGRKPHSAEKGTFSSPKTFFRAKTLMKVKEVPLHQMKNFSKSQSVEKTTGHF